MEKQKPMIIMIKIMKFKMILFYINLRKVFMMCKLFQKIKKLKKNH